MLGASHRSRHRANTEAPRNPAVRAIAIYWHLSSVTEEAKLAACGHYPLLRKASQPL